MPASPDLVASRRWLAPWPREAGRTELLDAAHDTPAELAQCLADIARLNRLGPTRALLRHLLPFFGRAPRDRPLRVLDLGTGAADIPLALVRFARRQGHPVQVFAIDLQPAVLACAALTLGATPEVRLVGGDALRPPVRRHGADVALCSLTLHHLPERQVVRLFQAMAEIARLGFVVSDLRRSRTAYVAAWLATRLSSRNRLTRHDGPLSVRRAYTGPELRRLADDAGLAVRWHPAPFFRLIGVFESPCPPPTS